MNKQEKYNILARHLAGELAREEKDDFLKVKEENAKQYHILRVFWESYFPKKPHSHKRIMSNVMGQLYGDNLSSKPTGPLAFWHSVAVILALALITSLSWQFFYHSPIVPVKYYHTGIGETKEIGLPDGSTVQLNSASTMIVKENFNSNNRQVILIGEAFFEVAKDKNKPFVVSTSHLNVRVLGTKFNLTSYGNDDKIVTYLEEGRVQIEGEFNNGTEKTLFPGQEATLDKKSLQLMVNDKKTSKHLWTEGELMFYNSSFEDIAKVLERKYNTKIVFMDEVVMNYRFSGDFSNSNLFELMGYLTAARSFNYKAKENIVIISK